MKACIILNPGAGSAADAEALADHVRRLPAIELFTTRQPGDATRIAHAALKQGAELVVAAGGDGTLNEVVNGMAVDFAQARLGVLPLGTGNDFARALGVPTDMVEAIELLISGAAEPTDVVRVTSNTTRYFINVSAGGFSGAVDAKLTEEVKQTWGPFAYFRSALQALNEITEYETVLTFDADPPVAICAYNVAVANGNYVAAGIPIAPWAKLNDGQLDVVVFPAASLPQLTVVAPKVLLGQHQDDERLVIRQARRLQVDSNPRMRFNADGEWVGDEPATFEVLPQALRVVAGSRTAFTAS